MACSSWTAGTLRPSGAIRLASVGFGLHPRQVQRVGGKLLDEAVLRHAAAVDRDATDLALVPAHLLYLRTQHGAQPVDGLDGEAQGHELCAERVLCLAIGGRVVAALLEGLAQLVEA